MSEVRLVVRDNNREWSGVIHGDSADLAIAALSADPATLGELSAACARFARPMPNRQFFANLLPGLCDEPHDAGLVVIDLIARLVVVDTTYSSPGSSGEVSYHDGERATDTWLPYHLADDWFVITDRGQWSAVAEKRRLERAARPLLDARVVFYDGPLLEFVARETFAAFARRATASALATVELPSDSPGQLDQDEIYETLKQIHAAWLLTPREDLGSLCPRDVALEGHRHLAWDLQDQCQRWSLLGKCPPGLTKSSFAFRYGGFGTHELVQYYGLVRELLWSCWQRLVELGKEESTVGRPEAVTVGDFLFSEVPRLESDRDHWLETPDPEFHGRTPRSIIDRERFRLPEAMCGADAVVDPDCPCCQMMADMPGPMFWHLDGSEMDDDFAFDISHRTREEWETEQRQWDEHRQRFDAEWRKRQRLGGSDRDGGATDDQSVWSSSFSVADIADAPLAVRLFGIGGHLAELIDSICGAGAAAPDGQRFVDRLNRDFGNLREILQNASPTLSNSLVEPVIDRFRESLAAVALARPDLSAKCESLTNGLAEFLDPHPPDSPWDHDDSDDSF
jgi:hypothetical protein